ncbi:MAG: hypothetical protein U0L65_02375 [Bacteroidales bacterium]|nr:hypothetical protein [Bacteroidales bacterium]
MKNEKTQLTREELNKACNIVFADYTDGNLLKIDAVEALRVLILIQDTISKFMGIYTTTDTISEEESFAVYMLSQTIKNLYGGLIETKQL